ncbi:hypothetical protein K450DRAFT_241056 [Umbelopsis ramanniana AG]|uniref:Uncharacterized protein n=1 Tax=Umbelopsis ramanniana AG TaxID=1314678 RepID=A0AAD5HEK5_UMBRA|nr:uncharacterized protein K450DRAFT_241056 [Umbelopsis ramanniana AG]KAI8579691.1 hypothetical protein K450DRAFT_241056 [Umbelopsis ramanniana AG]
MGCCVSRHVKNGTMLFSFSFSNVFILFIVERRPFLHQGYILYNARCLRSLLVFVFSSTCEPRLLSTNTSSAVLGILS